MGFLNGEDHSSHPRVANPRLLVACACCVLSIGVALASWVVNVGAAPAATLPTPATLCRKIFSDVSLSASAKMACATCHDPAHAHAQANSLAVQLGGADSEVHGFRAVPSLRYLNFNLPFFFQNDGAPTGGFGRDGSAKDFLVQAQVPMLAAHEMANCDAATFAVRLAAAAYADEFRRVYGDDIFADADMALLAAQYSLASFESSAAEFHPYDSKFDFFLKRRVMLSAQELRGYALFNRPDKGNCAGCHPSTRQADGSPPAFTDYTYDNLGVPRNPEIPANADPTYFDMGLCGPFRTDLPDRQDLCGQFKVPTLRNVVTRQVFFHNGRFHKLKDALRFYVQRDTNPEKFYPLDANGVPQKFNDVPALLARNINTDEAPYDRELGQTPALSDDEIDDVIVFLGTLTDGYDADTDAADPARDAPPQTN
jgi:cytochrome c peroxidase